MRNYLIFCMFCAVSLLQAQTTSTDTLDNPMGEDEIPVINLSDNDGADGGQFVPGLLTSGRDPFNTAVAFNLSAFRFWVRGYSSEYQTTYLNGIPVNELEDDRADFRDWRGLNDVTRSRQQTLDLSPVEYAFGGIGGATHIDTRSQSQRKQLRASYAISNRTYRNRVMVTYTSGALKGGWGFTFSGSKSWAEEGYQPGTFYDAYAYFASIDKKVNDRHALNLTFLGSPARIGRYNPSVREMYDLAGTNFYNLNWGYQNGEKRNSRVDDIHQPLTILRHDWKVNDKISLISAASYQFGRNGRSNLDWFNARDPRPDYYTRLPSYAQDDVQPDQVAAVLAGDEAARQIDWDNLYFANRLNQVTVENANGVTGNTVTGLRSNYILMEQRSDTREANFNTNLRYQLTRTLQVHGGAAFQYYKGMYFQKVLDLLGGDFMLDVNQFAERDFPDNSGVQQNNLDAPNRIVKEGERYGYSYDNNVRKGQLWGQALWTLNKLDAYVSAEVSNTRFWRFGNNRVGLFPENSYGKSEVQSFFNYGAKAGATYKINGRNFLYVRGMYQTRPPIIRNAFVSPRTRQSVAEGLGSSTAYSTEGGYQIRAPHLKVRISGYYTQFLNETETISFYHDEQRSFVNYTMTGIDRRHLGLEFAAQVDIYKGLSANAMAAVGQYFYSDRPTATITQDNNAALLEQRTVYIKNYYVAGSPQQGYNAGLRYNSKKFWFANLNVNYVRQNWMDINYDRRTIAGVSYDALGADRVLPGSELWNQILDQQQLPNVWTLDFFGGKSWKIDNYYIYLNAGVNNLLDREYMSGAFEQLRFDYEEKNVDKFPPRYFYGFGRNYFISLAVKI